ncbi:hypothetical protein MRB53_029349 [Persea americana]|uniref:Uncharacterized protein n=1 Tax=Persea americana TaxID=3435 RepID=A0ACC2KI67_PERAE|nr:hypothetical protein MRB53_029349 [Persea americana]
MSCEPGNKVHEDMEDKLSLKLLIDKTGNRLLFAEAGKDFIDLLLSFLALPLGSVIRLLANKSHIDVSISSLYESVENLSETYIRSGLDKISLQGLVTPSLSSCSRRSQPPPLLLYSDTDAKTEATTKWYYYTCDYSGSHPYYENGRQQYVSDVKGTTCPGCRRAMESEAEYVAPAPATTSSVDSGGDGKGEKSSEERGDLGALEEKVVKVGVEEVLSLLKASLQSKTALTDVFLK